MARLDNATLSFLLANPIVIQKELCERSFAHYVKAAWPVLHPGEPLIWGWHMEAVCEHLQAIDEGRIRHLVINIPPGTSKSLLTSILFPSWLWGPRKRPHMKFLNASYNADLTSDHGLRMRQLIGSEWYQTFWSDVFSMSREQYSKANFENSHFGKRIGTSVGGLGTGARGNINIIDDPHNVKESLSDVKRKEALTWWDLTMGTRVSDPETSTWILIMQRLHQDDLTGHIAETGFEDVSYLVLPMEYDVNVGNQCRTAIGYVDPRRKDGELLHPDRWTRRTVESLKRQMRMTHGDFGVNSQLQQRPTPLGGGMFKPENMVPLIAWPAITDMDRFVRYWDKAATEGSGCYTAGALLARHKSTNKTIVLDIHRGQWGTDKREFEIKTTAQHDVARLGRSRFDYEVCVEQEPGSGGKDSARWTVQNLVGFKATAIPKSESKENEWAPFASQVNVGGVEYVIGPYFKALKQEMEAAPFGKFKDQLDATSGAFKRIWLGPTCGVVC